MTNQSSQLQPALPRSAEGRQRCDICLLAQGIYPTLVGQEVGTPAQQRQAVMARWLSQRGHCVSIIDWDQGQADTQAFEGIRIIKMCRRGAGLPGLRWAHPSWSSLCRAMWSAKAQVYVCDSPGAAFAQMVMWCRGYGRRSIYAAFSDCDCDQTPPRLKAWTERLLHRRGVRLADRIVVGSLRQQQIVYNSFEKEAVVIDLPHDPDVRHETVNHPMTQFETVLRGIIQ